MAPHKISPLSSPIAESTRTNGSIEPSLPLANSCLSYWHRTTRAFPHLNADCTSPVPEESKFVIIGSGISGALTAYSLIEQGISGHDITIFEAREAVSGASGRNAGHVRPDAFRGFTGYAKLHGPEQAVKIIANEKLVFERLAEFVEQHKVECDFEQTTTFDVCLTPEFAEYEQQSLEAFVKAGGNVEHVKIFRGEDARRRTRVPGAISAYEWPAGSSHPAKLAQWLLTRCIEAGARLLTHCPITEIVPQGSSWRINSPRGTTAAEKVIHCTNAYASALLGQLHGFVTPNKAQAHALVPSRAFSGSGRLESTMSLRYSMHHFYSLIQRKGDGTVILGVSRANPELSANTKAQIVSFDDSSFNQEIVDDALNQFGIMFPETKSSQTTHGEGLDHAWTGVIGMTPDSVPLVGSIDELPGQFICAGFNGHGMARIWTSAPGLARLILGGSWQETGLPECFQYSADRISHRMSKNPKVSVW